MSELYGKYKVTKVDGEIDPEAEYFVLRMDTRGHAEMAAIRAYAMACGDAGLASDLLHYAGDPVADCILCPNCGAPKRSHPGHLESQNAEQHTEIERLRPIADTACEYVRRWNEPEQLGLCDSFVALCRTVQDYQAVKAAGVE